MKIKLVINKYKKFPQADDIYKVIRLCDSLNKNKFEHLLSEPKFNNDRQKLYYYDAARFLGLIEVTSKNLTSLGKSLFNKEVNEILRDLSKLIISSDIFYLIYREKIADAKELLTKRYKLSMSTVERRIGTARKWVNWAKINLKERNLEFYEV
jgi:hypothetical protein